MRPELEIRVEEKDTFMGVINDSIDIERRLAANSALQRNKNMEYSKGDEGVFKEDIQLITAATLYVIKNIKIALKNYHQPTKL